MPGNCWRLRAAAGNCWQPVVKQQPGSCGQLLATGRQATAGQLRATTGDCGRLQATAGDCGRLRAVGVATAPSSEGIVRIGSLLRPAGLPP